MPHNGFDDTPSVWRVPLGFGSSAAPTLAGVHALASSWLDDDGSHRVDVKSWSVRWPVRRPDGFDIVVNTFDAPTTERFLQRVRSGEPVRFGNVHGRVSGPPQLVRQKPWADWSREVTPNGWLVEFLSPTTFRRGNQFHPLPVPATILSGLLRSWSRFAPHELHAGVDCSHVWVSDVRGESVPVMASQRLKGAAEPVRLTISGFVGTMRLRCEKESRAAVHRLLTWAELTGVGAWTTKGLGTVRVTAD